MEKDKKILNLKQLLKVIPKCNIVPFGCEFTFIKRRGYDADVEKAVKYFHRFGYNACNDYGSLEIQSPVFYDLESCVDYWNKICRIARDILFFPTIGENNTGGLHIRLDTPDITFEQICQFLTKLAVFGRTLEYFNEPGDFNSAKQFRQDDFIIKLIQHRRDLPANSKFIKNIVEMNLYGNKDRVVSIDSYTSTPSIEFRAFDSPSNAEQLCLSVIICNSLLNLKDNERSLLFFAPDFYYQLKEFSGINLENTINHYFKDRFTRYEKELAEHKKELASDDE